MSRMIREFMITTEFTEKIHVVKENYEQLYANKLDNFDEMEKLSRK